MDSKEVNQVYMYLLPASWTFLLKKIDLGNNKYALNIKITTVVHQWLSAHLAFSQWSNYIQEKNSARNSHARRDELTLIKSVIPVVWLIMHGLFEKLLHYSIIIIS